jgi:hypothetical protein
VQLSETFGFFRLFHVILLAPIDLSIDRSAF